MKADFHIHSRYSYDAAGDIAAIFDAAETNGVSVIAITEHHHARSIPAALAESKRHPSVRYVPSIEATVNIFGSHFDVVCLNVDIDHPAYAEYERLHIEWQRGMNAAALLELNKQGIAMTADDMDAYMRDRCEPLIDAVGVTRIGAKPLANWLVKNGRMDDVEAAKTAVEIALGGGDPKGHHFAMPPGEKVIPLIREFSAVQSLAHAAQYYRGAALSYFPQLFDAIGFNAIECAHPSISAEQSAQYRKFCVDMELYSTAGTDCHNNDEYGALGSKGEPDWLEEVMERL
ncbi:MAG: PHP domain-containing protein [Planctomycetota bacterium]